MLQHFPQWTNETSSKQTGGRFPFDHHSTKNMKKNEPFRGSIHRSLRKIILIMKLFIILLFLAVFQGQATDVNEQNVTINVKATEIRKVLTALEKQTDLRF